MEVNTTSKQTIYGLFFRNFLILVLIIVLVSLLQGCSLYEVRTSFKNARKKIEKYHHSRLGKVNVYYLESVDPKKN